MGYIDFSFPFIPIHSHSFPFISIEPHSSPFMKPFNFVIHQRGVAEPLVHSVLWVRCAQRRGRAASGGLIEQRGTEDLQRHFSVVFD